VHVGHFIQEVLPHPLLISPPPSAAPPPLLYFLSPPLFLPAPRETPRTPRRDYSYLGARRRVTA